MAESHPLARALRAGRLTVLVGALGVGKSTLLATAVLPLLRRRVGTEPEQPGGAPQVAEPFPDLRSGLQGRGRSELLYCVDQWNEATLDALMRALAELPAAGRFGFDLAEAMSPEQLTALSQRHGGAQLLFVFDHFDLLLEGAQHSPDLQRFVDAWAAVLEAPDLDAHFLIAVDEQAWPRLQALQISIPQDGLQVFRLQARSGRRLLESLTDDQRGRATAQRAGPAEDFEASLGALVTEVAKSVRGVEPRLGDFAASLNAMVSRMSGAARPVGGSSSPAPSAAKRQDLVAAPLPERDAAAEEDTKVAAAAEAERHADTQRRAEAESKRQVAARAAESERAAAVAEAARQAAAQREAAERAAQAQRMAQAQQAAERRVEAARRAGAAQLAKAQRLAQALAAAEAAAAQEAQARQAAEAAAQAAQAEQRVEAARRAEAERDAEAARQAEAEQLAAAQRLARALAAAEAAAAREAQARHAAEAQQRAQEESLAAAGRAMPPPEAGATDAAVGLLTPAATSAWPARTRLLWGSAAVAAATAAVLWWTTRATPPVAPVAGPPVPASSAVTVAAPPAADSASTPAPVPAPAAASPANPTSAESRRDEVLVGPAGGTHSRIARELAAALSTEAAAMRVLPLADGTDPIAGLQVPGRLAIVRSDTLRAARGRTAPPLRVLTPLFPEAVLFVVRADSPLKYIHELRGRRLSVGPVQADGSHAVRAIYRRLFGAEMTEPAQFDTDQALAELVAFRSIDAMAIVEPQPSAWWAALDPRTAHRLRLLTLDPRRPADRRLVLAMSVARIGTGATTDKRATTPAVMSLLVASGEGDADVDRFTAMAHALCRELPRLREHGHPKWRDLQTAAQLDTGWPVVRSFQSVLSRCARR